MVRVSTSADFSETNRAHRLKLNVCYVAVALGFFVATAAYIQLLRQDASANSALPVGLAFVGFLISTVGFRSFAVLQKSRVMKGQPRPSLIQASKETPRECLSTLYTPSQN